MAKVFVLYSSSGSAPSGEPEFFRRTLDIVRSLMCCNSTFQNIWLNFWITALGKISENNIMLV